MKRYKHSLSKWLAVCMCLSMSPSYAGSFLDGVLDVIADFSNREKHVESDPNFTVDIPTDLPKHWRLQAFKENVFGGEILVAEVGSSDKPTVFLVHGLGVVGMRDWLTVVPQLESDYHVVLLDLPGFGASVTPAGKYSPQNYARVIAEVKEALVPDRKIKIVGHSMGGAVTLRFAEKYPERVSSIVLVDAAGILERTAFLKHNASIADYADFTPGKLREILKGVDNFSQNIIEIVSGFPDVSRLLVTESAWAAVFGRRANINAAFALIQENFGSAIEEVKMPVGIIWGEEDGIAPLRTGKLLNHHLASSSLLVISQAEHMPMKSHKEAFNNGLKVLLKSEPPEKEETPSATTSPEDLICKNKSGGQYSGVYKRISIESCSNIKLVDVVASELSIKSSTVQIENISIDTDSVALTVVDSTVLITNMSISADVGIVADHSRLDIAGARIIAKDVAVKTATKSRFIFSVSHIKSAYFSGRVHNLYQLENSLLDSVL